MTTLDSYKSLLVHAPAIRSFIAVRIPRVLRKDIDADDVLHDVWSRVLRSNQPSDIDKIGSVEPYLKRVALSVLVDHFRAQQAAKRGGKEDGPKTVRAHDLQTSYVNLFERIAGPRRTPSSEVAVQEATAAVQIALQGLPDTQREAVQLHHIMGLSYEEIGIEMNRTVASVHGLLDRGMKNLRTRLGSATQFLSDADSEAD